MFPCPSMSSNICSFCKSDGQPRQSLCEEILELKTNGCLPAEVRLQLQSTKWKTEITVRFKNSKYNPWCKSNMEEKKKRTKKEKKTLKIENYSTSKWLTLIIDNDMKLQCMTIYSSYKNFSHNVIRLHSYINNWQHLFLPAKWL